MPNAIKWTPGPPPEPRTGNYLCYCGGELIDTLMVGESFMPSVTVIAHALVNYPLTIHEAVTYDDATNSWTCWDINGTAFHTGLASREEAEAAYRDEYGDW